ncbi:hypothetical protein EA462_08640 [Natrarchaeobius halalkaliphilus]|uniref:Solute-binding protein family 5 domain-containing protein n=1 Tax=Natrarchaeobius halalkaliphilus TaxID=1679091 RepID=A0A3N6M9X9_9EURY|nr:ABC transporter substrate-binding protein [Natrarchaeobius halalkaliphilus]RQG90366.1 hypothetical protein EA462_08640 [Natrarchaeobius halalkaliphilus]
MRQSDTHGKGAASSSRRSVLKAAGATGVAAGLAGCSGFFGGGGETADGDYGIEFVEDPAGEPWDEIDYLTTPEDTSPIRYTYANLHAEYLEEIGFDVSVRAPSIPQYVDDGFVHRDFDIYVVRQLDGWDPDRYLHDAFHSSALAEGEVNISGYDNPDYDEMVDQQRGEIDLEARQNLVFEMQEQLMEEQIISPILVQNRIMAYNADRYQNAYSGPEEGLGRFWNALSIEPTDEGDESLVYSQVSDVNTLNPLSAERVRVERNIIKLMYDRLMRIPEEGVVPEPWMAESVESPDELTTVVTLRDDLEWHDGEDVTAEDVQFTFEYGQEHSSSIESTLSPLESIEVEDDLTVVFNFDEPMATFQSFLAGRNGSILPQHVWEDVPDSIDADTVGEWTNTDEPVGSGPFMLTNFEGGEELSLERFDGYFEQPNIDEIIRIESADTRGMVNALEDGTSDMVPWELAPEDVDRFDDDDSFQTVDAFMTSIHYACYNMRRHPYDITEVRRGLAHCIPKEEAVEIATAGTAEVIQAPISPALDEWYHDGVEHFNLDLEAAVQELEEAGCEWDMDGQIHLPPQ